MAQVADTTTFYVGLKLRWQDGIWEIVEYDHHKMGRGGAVVRTKLRNVETGSIVENSFKPGEKFERIIYEDKPAQYSYRDGEDYVFMDLATYEEMRLSPQVLGNAAKYLVDDIESCGISYLCHEKYCLLNCFVDEAYYIYGVDLLSRI